MAASSARRSGNYGEAIAALNTLQSNAAIIEAIRKSGGKLNELAIPEMVEYLERIGWQQSDLDRLGVIHITGTKGKGSTAAFVDSLVRHTPPSSTSSSSSAPRVGLYTSPHLVQVRERIRLDGKPIDEERFTHYFWDVWNKLEENQTRARPDITPIRPVYFRYLTILAFHVFLSLNVKCSIFEVGIGGRFDSTNIVNKPVAAGISTLGLDHVALLGNTIESIAAHKAGIFKKDCPATSVWQQSEGARQVVEEEAKKVGASSFKQLPQLEPTSEIVNAKRGIPGDHQASNAQLAVELYRTYMRSDVGKSEFKADQHTDADRLTETERRGLENARWPGRCQVVRSDTSKDGASATTWCLDGAHTSESLQACAAWFTNLCNAEGNSEQGSTGAARQGQRTLIFNTTHDRDSENLLRGMLKAIASEGSATGSDKLNLFFDNVIFSTNSTYRQGRSAGDLTDVAGPVSLDSQESIQRAWRALDPEGKTQSHVCASIEEAIEKVEEQAGSSSPQHVLVCGSLHLVGGVMSHLKDNGLLNDALNSVH